MLPDFIKKNPGTKIKGYMQAIELDGYSDTKIRKLVIPGNKGINF